MEAVSGSFLREPGTQLSSWHFCSSCCLGRLVSCFSDHSLCDLQLLWRLSSGTTVTRVQIHALPRTLILLEGEKTLSVTLTYQQQMVIGFHFFIVLLFICAYKAWFISPPCPPPYNPLHPLPLLQPPQYQAEIILPLSLILLKREYKQ
jgi:hypothetical protein